MTDELKKTHRQAALAITGAYQPTSHINLLAQLGLKTLQERKSKSKLILFYKIKNNLDPEYTKTSIPDEVGENVNYELRNVQEVKPRKTKTNYLLKSYIPSNYLIVEQSSTHSTLDC